MTTTNDPLALKPNVPQFIFDDALIAHQQRVTRRWMQAKVYPDPLLRPDKPWEGRCLKLYGTVVPEPEFTGLGGWRMYYDIFNPTFTFKKREQKVPIAPGMLMARSDDGLTWEKPELDVVTWPDGRKTNFVAHSGKHLDGAPLIYEPDDVERPFKMIGFSFDNVEPMWNDTFGLYTRFSSDGVHFTPQGDKPVVRAGDRTNLMGTKWKGHYLAHTRAFPGDTDWSGGRAIFETTSPDFAQWSKPQLVLAMDLLDEPDTEYYGMVAFERHGWMIGLLERWRSATDTLELHLALSRDGRTWIHPIPRQPFIPNCFDWNRKWVTCASNGPILLDELMVFHFGGGWSSHHWDALHLHGVIGAASIPIDRFCAIEGTNVHNAHLITVPIVWPGGDLVLNADTRSNPNTHPAHCDGAIQVEVLDAEGKPLRDFSGDKKATFAAV
jgi:hypothetical protein